MRNHEKYERKQTGGWKSKQYEFKKTKNRQEQIIKEYKIIFKN